MEDRKILVLGVGNILLRDEGAGVRVVERLQAGYDFSGNVELVDGGTLGLRLMDMMMQADLVIVADAVLGGGEPGTLYRLTGNDLRKSIAFKNSLHQSDLCETLTLCEIVGKRPEAVVVGIEPADYAPWSDELTPTISGRLPAMAEAVLKEIADAGGSWTSRAG